MQTADATAPSADHADDPDRDRWAAVLARDPAFDGAFVFAVATTGIYCRPSCPARRAQRRNVAFYADAAEAERAGYRPCRRCAPDGGGPEAARRDAVRRACDFLDAHADGPPTLAALARHVGLSPSHLQRLFTRALGVSPRAYADARRTARLKAHLRAGEDVTGALYAAGFGAPSRLYEQAGATLGMTPGAYRRRGRGLRIAFAVAPCALGRVLVATTARGVCAVYLGDDARALEAELRAEFAAAEIDRDDSALAEAVAAVVARIDGKPAARDLPLDAQGTAFQRRVWEELRRIPPGETRSYSAVAEALGRPTATRAVARACATNQVSVLIPCHRVLRADGGLGGYRWGIARKRALLDVERKDGPARDDRGI